MHVVVVAIFFGIRGASECVQHELTYIIVMETKKNKDPFIHHEIILLTE